LLAKPIVDVGNGSTGFREIVPGMANTTIDFAHHMCNTPGVRLAFGTCIA
jgi:hypothetical protein